ncbi:hypothetical protein Tco_1562026 [Tanacetum coccineum]
MANKKFDDCSTTETTSINNVGVVDVSILKFSGHWQSDCKLARQRPDGIVLVIDFTIVGVQTTTYMSNNVPSVTGNHHIFHQPPNASDFYGRKVSTLSSLELKLLNKDRAKPIDTVKKSELKAKFQVATVIAVCANWEFVRIEGIGCISVISLHFGASAVKERSHEAALRMLRKHGISFLKMPKTPNSKNRKHGISTVRKLVI